MNTNTLLHFDHHNAKHHLHHALLRAMEGGLFAILAVLFAIAGAMALLEEPVQPIDLIEAGASVDVVALLGGLR